MNFSGLIPFTTYPNEDANFKSSFNKTETSKGIFYLGKDLYGDNLYEFSVQLIWLYDIAIVTNNLHSLSIEQERLLEKYFLEADTITPPDELIDLSGWVYNFASLSSDIFQLDEYLGSYIGDNYDQPCCG